MTDAPSKQSATSPEGHTERHVLHQRSDGLWWIEKQTWDPEFENFVEGYELARFHSRDDARLFMLAYSQGYAAAGRAA